MDNDSIKINKSHKNHYNEEKYELFFDYDNSYSFETMSKGQNCRTYQLKNEYSNPIPNSYKNYSEFDNNNFISNNKSYNEAQSTKINSSFNSYSLNEYIQNKKEVYNKISNSMNKIINKHKNDYKENDYNLEYKKKNKIIINDFEEKKNLNQIVDHLIKVYSKDELKFIKEKIKDEVDEEEPKPEKLYIYPLHRKNNLKLSSDSPSFLKIHPTNNYKDKCNIKNYINKDKDKNKNLFFKKIKKNMNYKPIKINCSKITNKKKIINNDYYKNNNTKNFLNKTYVSKNSNVKFKPEFYNYIKCKTTFEYIDNFLKRQKTYNNYVTNKKINLNNCQNNIESKINNFIPNTSLTSSSK